MRQLLIAFFLLLAAPTWAETRDPVNHFFQPKFGDFKADLQESRARKAFSCSSKWMNARSANA